MMGRFRLRREAYCGRMMIRSPEPGKWEISVNTVDSHALFAQEKVRIFLACREFIDTSVNPHLVWCQVFVWVLDEGYMTVQV